MTSTHDSEETDKTASRRKASGHARLPVRVIRTLDPTHLQASDFYDISGVPFAGFNVDPNIFPSGVNRSTIIYAEYRAFASKMPFPAGTHGFLYCSVDSSASPAGSPDAVTNPPGQIRFRITPSSDPATFAAGRDLQLPTGLAWHTYPRGLATCLRMLLVQDKYISLEADEDYRIRRRTRYGAANLTHFGQPFLLDFSRWTMEGTIVSKIQRGKAITLRLGNPMRAKKFGDLKLSGIT